MPALIRTGPNYWLWNGGSGGIAGSNLLANGVSVSLNPVPTTSAGWTNAPFEAQYLKLYDVTPPAAPAAPTATNTYVVGNNVVFSWPAVSDTIGGISGIFRHRGHHARVPQMSSAAFVSGTSLTVSGSYGMYLYAEVSAVNNAGIQGAFSASSSGVALVDPGWIPVASMPTSRLLNWNSVSGKTYQVWSTTNLAFRLASSAATLTCDLHVCVLPQ